MLITNIEKFKEVCSKYPKVALKALLDYVAFRRVVCECVLIDLFHSCDKVGKLIPKTETLDNYSNLMEGERILIGLLGRKEAAKVYGALEGITSDVKTVDYILQNDSVEHYKELISTSIVQ
jgi:hypothetical protein